MSVTFGACCNNFTDGELEMAPIMMRLAASIGADAGCSVYKILVDERDCYSSTLMQTKQNGIQFTDMEENSEFFLKKQEEGGIRMFHMQLYDREEETKKEIPIPFQFIDNQQSQNTVFCNGTLLDKGITLNNKLNERLAANESLFEALSEANANTSNAQLMITDEAAAASYFINIGNNGLYFAKLSGSIWCWCSNKALLSCVCELTQKRIASITTLNAYQLITLDYENMKWKHENARLSIEQKFMHNKENDNKKKTLKAPLKTLKTLKTLKDLTPSHLTPTTAASTTKSREVYGKNGETMNLTENIDYRSLNVIELTTRAHKCMYCASRITPGERVFYNVKTFDTLHHECSSQELFSILKDA